MQVELIGIGGYHPSMKQCIGKIFTAQEMGPSLVLLPVKELAVAGYTGDAVAYNFSNLAFKLSQVRVIE